MNWKLSVATTAAALAGCMLSCGSTAAPSRSPKPVPGPPVAPIATAAQARTPAAGAPAVPTPGQPTPSGELRRTLAPAAPASVAAAAPRQAALHPQAAAGQVAPARPDGAPERGWQLFQKQCSMCHGVEGRGDGLAAYLLNPPPRDFTASQFRLSSTQNGVPTDDDLLAVVTNGMPGSAMPPWSGLPESDRRDLVATVKALWVAALVKGYHDEELTDEEIAESLADEAVPGKPVTFGGMTEGSLSETARGRIVYTKACALCHGPDGRGDSPQKLVDSQGRPLPARDFTKGIFKGGGDARSIYARLRSGMRGTPMPQYTEDALHESDAWALVHYIRSLFPDAAQARQRQTPLALAIRKVAEIPSTEDGWAAAAPSTYVALMPLWWRDRRPEGVLVQAVHDGRTLVLRLSWEDPTEDDNAVLQDGFTDGAALQLSTDADPPFFGMGDAAGSVAIWSWKASWQRDLVAFADVESVYPQMNLDSYYPVQTNLAAGDRPVVTAMAAPVFQPLYMSGWGAGNLVSDPDRAAAVEVVQANGQGTLASQPRAEQTVQGTGRWEKGVWTVELRAAMTPDRCRGLSVAFAVWDGGQRDRNGQKSVSIWHHLDLEP